MKGINSSCPLLASPKHLTFSAIPGRLKCSCNWAATQINQLAIWPQNIHGRKFNFWELLFIYILSIHCRASWALRIRNKTIIVDSRLHLSQIKLLHKIWPLTFYWLRTQVKYCNREHLSSREQQCQTRRPILWFRSSSSKDPTLLNKLHLSQTQAASQISRKWAKWDPEHHYISRAYSLSFSHS